jgi:hypothetical protein
MRQCSRGRDRMVVGSTTSYAINAYHHKSCEFEFRSAKVYSIQQYVIQFVSDLRQVGGFLWVLQYPSQIKLTATILLKVAFNKTTLTLFVRLFVRITFLLSVIMFI